MVPIDVRISAVEKTTESKRNRPVVRYVLEDAAGKPLGDFMTPIHSGLAKVLLDAAGIDHWSMSRDRVRARWSDREVS
jgi:hypothetical protein